MADPKWKLFLNGVSHLRDVILRLDRVPKEAKLENWKILKLYYRKQLVLKMPVLWYAMTDSVCDCSAPRLPGIESSALVAIVFLEPPITSIV